MRPVFIRPLLALALLSSAGVLQAQSSRDRGDSDAEWLDRCRNDGDSRRFSDDSRARACEVRNIPVRLSGRSIQIDGRQNGGIRVFGWDGDSVRVTARMQAQARTDAVAKDVLSRIRVQADGRSVRTDGPSNDGYDGWD